MQERTVRCTSPPVPRRSVAAVISGPGRVRFEAAEELVIDVAPAEPQFPNAVRIAVGSDGTIFTFDALTDLSLGAFSPLGAPVGDWAAAEGVLDSWQPGALVTIGAEGENLIVARWSPEPSVPGHLSVFGPDGNHVRGVDTAYGVAFPHPLPDGRTVVFELSSGVLGLVAPDGNVTARFTVFRMDEPRRAGDARLWPREAFAAGGDRVYVTAGADYEVAAFDAGAEVVWVLDAPWRRDAIPEHLVSRTIGRTERVGRTMAANLDEDADSVWPDLFPALAEIESDDQGRLYVFPYVVETDVTEFPVDVYTVDGELIANGTLPFQGWNVHRGDRVFRVEQRGGRTVIVRYRLQLPPRPSPAVSAGQ